MLQVCRLILLAVPAALLLGCGSTQQTEETIPSAFPRDSVVAETQPSVIQLEAKTDTLATLGVANQGTDASAFADSTTRFAVQVGAFKEPKNAAAMQALVRQHCQEPVMNEFNAKTGLYRIRVGRFSSQADAALFLRSLISEHSSTYTGSWVVQLGK
jgi:cell division protein FtsN